MTRPKCSRRGRGFSKKIEARLCLPLVRGVSDESSTNYCFNSSEKDRRPLLVLSLSDSTWRESQGRFEFVSNEQTNERSLRVGLVRILRERRQKSLSLSLSSGSFYFALFPRAASFRSSVAGLTRSSVERSKGASKQYAGAQR